MKLEIKVFPRSSQEKLVKTDGTVKAYVKAAPDKGKANKALIALIAKEYKKAKSGIKIIKGKTGRNKIVEVAD